MCGSFKATITIPEDAWDQFVSAVDEATEEVTPDDADVMIINWVSSSALCDKLLVQVPAPIDDWS